MYDYNGLAIESCATSTSGKTLGIIGDSISSDIATADYLAWPKQLAIKWGSPTLSRNTVGGARIFTSLKGMCNSMSSDCDMVIVAMGRNDVQMQDVGDLDTIMSAELSSLENSTTTMGIYRYALETLKNRLKNTAVIVCVSPITETLIDGSWSNTTNANWKATYDALVELRTAIRDFTIAEGGACSGWFFVPGDRILSADDKDIYYMHDGAVNTTHPNRLGEALIASYIYNHVVDINLL